MTVGLIQRCGLVSPSSRESFSVAVKWWLAGVALFGAVTIGLVLSTPPAGAESKGADAGAERSNVQRFEGARTAGAGISIPDPSR